MVINAEEVRIDVAVNPVEVLSIESFDVAVKIDVLLDSFWLSAVEAIAVDTTIELLYEVSPETVEGDPPPGVGEVDV